MSKKVKLPETSREFIPEEIDTLIAGLFEFLREKQDNIFVDDYFILEKNILNSDFEILKQHNEKFKTAYENGMKIEQTKLKKYASADRLNASFVRAILDRDHNQ